MAKKTSERRRARGDEGLVVAPAFGAFAVVVGPRRRVVQGRERGEEQGAFEFLVPALARMLAPDGRPGAPGDRCDPGVGRQVGGAGEVFARDFGEDAGAGPDADARHRGQDFVKRVGLHEGFDLGCDVVALVSQGEQLFGQFRQYDPCCTDADDH
jgi:hypothetical protein